MPGKNSLVSFKGPPLRGWQVEAFNHWCQYNKGIIQAVPGSGKTILAINAFCQKINENPNIRVLIVCPRLSLIRQWTDEIVENTSISKKEIYEISSHNEVGAFRKAQEKFDNYKVFISTFNQIKQFFSESMWKNHEWFLIVDEMHNTTEGYNFPDDSIKYKLGLSATPNRRGKPSTFNLGGIIYAYTFEEALRDKIILEPEFKLILYSVDKQLFEKIVKNEGQENLSDSVFDKAYNSFMHDSKKQKNKKDSSEEETLNEEKLDEEVQISLGEGEKEKREGENDPDFFTSRNVDYMGIQKILTEKFGIGKDAQQTLVFVNRIKKADLLSDMLNESVKKGVSLSYHSQIDEYNQKNHFEEISNKFEKNLFNVLISVSTLGEGIDFPYASCGILASPVHNPTAFVQKVGRLLRKYKDQEKAVIYYYVPSELITRLLSDPKISPNYLKSVLKIADEHKNLYFADRKTLEEKRCSLADLLSQGAAYERNEEIERIKVPKKLDSILRLFSRVYPKSFKHWRKFCNEEDFSELEEKIFERKKTALMVARNLHTNISKVYKLQEIVSKETGYAMAKDLVEESLREGVIVRIKYGAEIENFYLDKPSKLDKAEQKMLISSLKAEYDNFKRHSKDTKKIIESLTGIISVLKKPNVSKEKAIENMFALAKNYFALQSIFLDQLELGEVAKMPSDEKFILTMGKDLFVASAEIKPYAYPEEFGLSRWQEVKAKEAPKPIPGIEQYCKALCELMLEKVGTKEEWEELKKQVQTKTGFTFTDEEIRKELEMGKIHSKYPLMKSFFALETLAKLK